jgi:hypothetical protein
MMTYFPFTDYWWFYLGFTGFVVALLALDLGVFHRKAHAVSIREASIWSAVWIGLALAFNFAFYQYAGWKFARDPRLLQTPGFDPESASRQVGLEFLTGYVVEKVLSLRQHLRVRGRVHVLRRSGHLSAPRAVLRDPRRPGVPCHVYRRRLGTPAVSLGDSSLRRVADPDRAEDDVRSGQED